MEDSIVTFTPFKGQFLAAAAGSAAVSTAMSPTYAMDGNCIRFSAKVLNSNAAVTLTLYLEMSYTGSTWKTLQTLAVTTGSIGFAEQVVSSVRAGFVRLRARATGTAGQSVLFDAAMAFSNQ